MTPASILKHRAGQPQVAPLAGPNPSVTYRRQDHPRRRAAGDENDSAFYGFLRGLIKLWLFPIIFPLKKMYQIATSPLTISLTVKSILLATLLLASGILSTLSVATFWYTWGRTGSVEVEGWLIYGSKMYPTPHTQITFAPAKLFPQDIAYDVEVELELLRPRLGSDDLGSFMITMDLISERSGDSIVTISQPCLPALPYIPPGILSRLISIPLAFSPLNLYSVIPMPRIRSANPLKLFGILSRPKKSRRSGKASKDKFLLVRPMTDHEDGLILRPSGRKSASKIVGGVKLVIGREDGAGGLQGEVKTGGWAIVRFTPRATGLKWLMTSHWSIPAMILPPIAFGLTLSSALASFVIISLFFRPANHIPAARLPPLVTNTRQVLTQDGKKVDNDPLGRRSVSFVESGAAEPMDTGRGGLILRASGRDDGIIHVRPVPHNETVAAEAVTDSSSPTPSTPVKRAPGQSGGKIAQKSPAPSAMLQRRGSGGRDVSSDDDDDDGMKESLGLGDNTFDDSVTETGTETETETGTDKDT